VDFGDAATVAIDSMNEPYGITGYSEAVPESEYEADAGIDVIPPSRQ
jgi:hypothetical protein